MQNNLRRGITISFTVCQVSILGRRHINNVVVPSLTAPVTGRFKRKIYAPPPAVAMSTLNHGEVFGCGRFMSVHNHSQSRETREAAQSAG